MRKKFTQYKKAATAEIVINFLKIFLKEFNPKNSDIKENDREGLINDELEHFLDVVASDNDYRFRIKATPENRENQSKVDFAFRPKSINNSQIFFTIEAKRLPAYKTNIKTDYVCNDKQNGGIERFKWNKHGIDKNGKPIPQNAMIAYIEEHDFEYWYNQINEWILEQEDNSTALKWTKDEVLVKISFDEIATLQSNHLRINNENVMLNHFWIYLQH
ncbi:MAG TPA: hypothetical protein DCQ31_13750 [Bacteroidales bacterium]|nr:hypothetical protein [Bacteroidales bacterium]